VHLAGASNFMAFVFNLDMVAHNISSTDRIKYIWPIVNCNSQGAKNSSHYGLFNHNLRLNQ